MCGRSVLWEENNFSRSVWKVLCGGGLSQKVCGRFCVIEEDSFKEVCGRSEGGEDSEFMECF